ncbi:hypothetical protein L0P88_21805 [Muricauda sp. SCSIO 64092]|uniref:hypothetical protein n=1 Tax=Allomuricauda sp. SCSIO 64092 TaxID=2908842 RepID=UPI001FF1DACA|nr:hypothetical protein [Muricauda sp. SCSIO 64092]UOY06546.1 hypothetical protein L0P88_21805 [Muricauda sp. SCSIO 64092]
MKKLYVTIVLVLFSIGFSAAQSKLTDADLQQQGYNNGCELRQSDDIDLYRATISNPNFPQAYLDGVMSGWLRCSGTVKKGQGKKEKWPKKIGPGKIVI